MAMSTDESNAKTHTTSSEIELEASYQTVRDSLLHEIDTRFRAR